MSYPLRAVPCFVCKGDRFDVLLTPADVEAQAEWLRQYHAVRSADPGAYAKDKVEFTQANPTFIVECRTCGTLLRNPQPTPEALRLLYARDEYGEETLQALLANAREWSREKARGLCDRLREGAMVLEVGPFVGAFLLAACEMGWQAEGVDIGEETSEFMRGMGLTVHQGDVRDLDLEPGWDAVCVWNTFDQLDEPRKVLASLHALLGPDGLLVLRVPNGAFMREAWEALPARLDPPGGCGEVDIQLRELALNNFLAFPYLVGYTPWSLQTLLEGEGFLVESLVGDVILPMATPDTLPCAVEEEQEARRSLERERTDEEMPWLDIVARKAEPSSRSDGR